MSAEKDKLYLITPVAVAAVSLALLAVALSQSWFGLPQWSEPDFCEAAYPGLIRHPSNTWSNLAFIAAGFLMAWQMWQGVYQQNKNCFTQKRVYTLFYISIVILIAPGSMALHATDTNAGRFFDWFCMYMTASFMAAYSLERFFRLEPIQFILLFIIFWVTCLWAYFQQHHFIFEHFRTAVFAFFVALTTLFEFLNIYIRKLTHCNGWLFGSLVTFIIAYSIWHLFEAGGPLCHPYASIQGHALWQILCALSLYFLFRYYVSEKRTELTKNLQP